MGLPNKKINFNTGMFCIFSDGFTDSVNALRVLEGAIFHSMEKHHLG